MHSLDRALWRALFRMVLGRRLPTHEGVIETHGLAGPVRVLRDRHGVPHIEAGGDRDAWFALGFCQAQDRAFQLEALLRVVRGTVSEMVGAGGLAVDKVSRRLGFHRAARRQVEALDRDIRESLVAFAEGVNAGLWRGARRRPHEFTLLRARPSAWEATDVLGISKAIGLLLSANWDLELARLKILAEDGWDALLALHPALEREPARDLPTGEALTAVVDQLSRDLGAWLGGSVASNNWAIAPAATASGRALVANDLHLDPGLPSYFYLVHLRTPGWALAGAVLAGTPVVAAGHNGAIAWGVTAGLVDNTDLFVEAIGPNGKSVRAGDDFVPCATVRERIEVRRSRAVTEEVLITPRGPIVGRTRDGGRLGLSVSATWMSAGPMAGLFRAHACRTCAELREQLRAWPSVSLNVVAADRGGAISWQLVGEVPRRRKGWGTVPLAGWDANSGWLDTAVAFDDLPHSIDPSSGFVCSANNQPRVPDGPWLGGDWIDDYRYLRIEESLRVRRDWNVRRAARLQMDLECVAWRDLRPALLNAPCPTPEARRARSLLESWDGWVGPASAGAAVFEVWLSEMVRRLLQRKAARAVEWGLGGGITPLTRFSAMGVRQLGWLVRMVTERPDGWFDRTWDEEVGEALDAAARALAHRHGRAPGRWAWGRVRPLWLRHPLGVRRPLDRIYNLGPFEWGGDANTVGQAAPPPLDPWANPVLVASLRMVCEIGDWDGARFVLAGGQSGNPLSPHYADQLALWRAGGGVSIAWTPEAVARATLKTLELRPVPARPAVKTL